MVISNRPSKHICKVCRGTCFGAVSDSLLFTFPAIGRSSDNISPLHSVSPVSPLMVLLVEVMQQEGNTGIVGSLCVYCC